MGGGHSFAWALYAGVLCIMGVLIALRPGREDAPLDAARCRLAGVYGIFLYRTLPLLALLSSGPVPHPYLNNRAAPMRLMTWDILSHPDCDTCLLTAGHPTP